MSLVLFTLDSFVPYDTLSDGRSVSDAIKLTVSLSSGGFKISAEGKSIPFALRNLMAKTDSLLLRVSRVNFVSCRRTFGGPLKTSCTPVRLPVSEFSVHLLKCPPHSSSLMSNFSQNGLETRRQTSFNIKLSLILQCSVSNAFIAYHKHSLQP